MRCSKFRFVSFACVVGICLFAFGCATAPEVVYVKEAQQVTTEALDPVMLESAELEADVSSKFAASLKGISVEEILTAIQTEIANTKRFTKVLLNGSEGDTYIVQPRIERIETKIANIQTDPTRKRLTTRAKVKLDVLFINQRNQKELVKSFYDDRKLEDKIPAKGSLGDDQKSEFVRRAVIVAFRSAADQLGNGFNPSYEMGAISKLNGRTAHVQINTSKLRKMPKKQQAVEVIDDDNKVLATIAELAIEDGSLSGKLYEKSGVSIKEGSKVRARVNALTQ
ncbi:MAG: hypothetical protein PHD54_00870 [Desulfuromonadaceae bacterium]|nr:hypothetical protein [Desulfuromonadaceae bacterium]